MAIGQRPCEVHANYLVSAGSLSAGSGRFPAGGAAYASA